MAKKHSTLKFMLKRDLLLQTVFIAFALVAFGIIYSAQGYEVIISGDMMLVMIVAFFGTQAINELFPYDGFQTFLFSRKRFYRYQVVLVFARSAELAIVRTVYQILLHEDIIRYIMEDENAVIGDYGQMPAWWELLLTNIFIFALIGLALPILNTLTCNFNMINFNVMKDSSRGCSLQHTQRIAEHKEKHPKSWKWMYLGGKIVGFVIMIVYCILVAAVYSDIQLSEPLYVRMIVLAVLILLSIVLYFIGKKRYVPEYI